MEDYIENGRPNSANEHIFLNRYGYGVISGATVSQIAPQTFSRTDIDCKGKKRGPHALRSSLATALLTEGNDYIAIQKVLGHRDIQSAKSYARADVEHLRGSALSVPSPIGNFEMLLKLGGAVNG